MNFQFSFGQRRCPFFISFWKWTRHFTPLWSPTHLLTLSSRLSHGRLQLRGRHLEVDGGCSQIWGRRSFLFSWQKVRGPEHGSVVLKSHLRVWPPRAGSSRSGARRCRHWGWCIGMGWEWSPVPIHTSTHTHRSTGGCTELRNMSAS